MSSFRPAERARVVVYKRREDFRRKNKGTRDEAVTVNNSISSYEQENLKRALVGEAARLWFKEALGRPSDKDLRWLRQAVPQLVGARRAGADLDESRLRWKRFLKTEKPVDFATFSGEEKPGTADNMRRRFQLTAASLTAFLSDWGGNLAFAQFLTELKAGKSVDDALARSYPGKIRTLRELYDFWRAEELNSASASERQPRLKAPKTPGRTRK